jgi:hypothetical protein
MAFKRKSRMAQRCSRLMRSCVELGFALALLVRSATRAGTTDASGIDFN